MQIYKTKWFDRWAAKEGLSDAALRTAIEEMASGLVDAELGGHVFKKRVGLRGRGKRGGIRTLVAVQWDKHAFFVYGFSKNERANVSDKELRAFKLLATELLGYSSSSLVEAMTAGELIKVMNDE